MSFVDGQLDLAVAEHDRDTGRDPCPPPGREGGAATTTVHQGRPVRRMPIFDPYAQVVPTTREMGLGDGVAWIVEWDKDRRAIRLRRHRVPTDDNDDASGERDD